MVQGDARALAVRVAPLKASFNAAEDGLAGIQQLAHDANLLFYGSEEAKEGRTRTSRSANRLLPFPARLSVKPLTAMTADATHIESGRRELAGPSRRAPERGVRIWLMAARLRTLPAAVAPVLVGTSLALGAGHFRRARVRGGAAGSDLHPGGHQLVKRLLRRAARRRHRGPAGPVRVTAGGLVPPGPGAARHLRDIRLAVLCGVYLVAVAGRELIAVGGASILAGVLYTGGPRPYGYEGLGELFVFLFFGIVAVTGSYFVQVQALPWQAFACAVPVGLLASAILVVNNVRDLETDRRAASARSPCASAASARGRSTRRWSPGRSCGRRCRGLLGSMTAWLMSAWLAIPLAVAARADRQDAHDGPALNGALAKTGMLQLVFCLLFAAGILAERRDLEALRALSC